MTLPHFFGWGFISRHGAYQWSSSPRTRPSYFGNFVLMCSLLAFLSHTNNTSFLFHFFSLASFNMRVMQICGDIMGLGLYGSFHGPLAKRQAWLSISFGGIGISTMEDCAPSSFLRSWVLVVLYLCSRFCIFDKLVMERYFFKLKGAHTCFNHAYM